jgi:magnesium transporter
MIVAQIGRSGDLTSKAHESLVTVARVVTYLAGSDRIAADKFPKDLKLHLKSASRDVSQLADHASYLSNKISFLLEAVTGLITIQQNDIIKIFSVVSVALMPPTLIASIYGMNFEYMPELTRTWGYPAALIAMACSAVFPFAYFRRRGWL